MSSELSKAHTAVGFIGLGNLGGPMARRLHDQGWNLTVHDAAERKLQPFRNQGIRAPGTAAEALAADVLVLVVPDDEAATALLTGEHGYLARGGQDRLVVMHSTILPRTAQRLAAQAGESGVGFLDAPVSGGSERAATGDLTVYLGGSTQDGDRAAGLLADVASTVKHVGEPGAASAVKLANQVMLFSALGGIHEALALASAYGVQEDTVIDAVSTSTGASWASGNWGFFDRTARSYTQGGTAVRDRPWNKDLFEVLMAARAGDVDLPITAVLSQTLTDYIEDHAGREQA